MPMLEKAEFDWVRKVGRGAKMLGGGSLGVKDTPTTAWFKYGVYGFCGVITLGDKKRVKGIYVFPEWRGRGIGTSMTDALIELCQRDESCKTLEAYTVNAPWYIARGWEQHGETGHGYAIVRKDIQ
jgi:ribosomal protein S18 acetylase RimI-like enzyme